MLCIPEWGLVIPSHSPHHSLLPMGQSVPQWWPSSPALARWMCQPWLMSGWLEGGVILFPRSPVSQVSSHTLVFSQGCWPWLSLLQVIFFPTWINYSSGTCGLCCCSLFLAHNQHEHLIVPPPLPPLGKSCITFCQDVSKRVILDYMMGLSWSWPWPIKLFFLGDSI